MSWLDNMTCLLPWSGLTKQLDVWTLHFWNDSKIEIGKADNVCGFCIVQHTYLGKSLNGMPCRYEICSSCCGIIDSIWISGLEFVKVRILPDHHPLKAVSSIEGPIEGLMKTLAFGTDE